MADDVRKKRCGIIVDLNKLKAISEEEYAEYRYNILKVAKKDVCRWLC